MDSSDDEQEREASYEAPTPSPAVARQVRVVGRVLLHRSTAAVPCHQGSLQDRGQGVADFAH